MYDPELLLEKLRTLLEALGRVPRRFANIAIGTKWTEVAKRRLPILRSGKVKPIPGDEVFSEVLKWFAK
jgi:hypothetical protein